MAAAANLDYGVASAISTTE